MRPSDPTTAVWAIGLVMLLWASCPQLAKAQATGAAEKWTLGALPAGATLERPWEKNWVFDGKVVNLTAARGQYVSFQVVIGRTGDETLDDVVVEMPAFKRAEHALSTEPELFLEWCVQVTNRTSQYPKWSTGTGWYPDALIPLDKIQMDLSKQHEMVSYALRLPDFRNRIEGQRFMMIWVDQFVPAEREAAAPGLYKTEVRVRVDGESRTIPVELNVWDFTLPQENGPAAGFQQEGFLAHSEDKIGIAVQQHCKRHRVVLIDPNIRPKMEITPQGKVEIDWTSYDAKVKKYLTGEVFTKAYGYSGPSYGEPVEWFLMPFNVAGRWGSRGWPDIGPAETEREPEKQAVYIDAIKQVRQHVLEMADPKKTRLVVYLNGLDESYFPEAWDRMVHYGKLFKEHFPEVGFRVDGGYSAEAMEVIHKGVNLWVSHTTSYDLDTIEANRKLGVRDMIYGPMLHEDPEKGNDMSGSNWFMDVELLTQRAPSWIWFKYDALTWLHWGLVHGWEGAWYNSEQWVTLFRYLGEGEFKESRFNGDGYGLYAPNIVGRVNVPCASIRMKNVRDGVQEYLMLRLLSKIDGNRRRADAIVNGIVNRPLGKVSFGRWDVWQHDPAKWDAARQKLGELLAKQDRR